MCEMMFKSANIITGVVVDFVDDVFLQQS